MKIVDFIRNVVNSFLTYICCAFVLLGVAYLDYMYRAAEIPVESEQVIHSMYVQIGYVFFILNTTIALARHFTLDRFCFPFSQVAASVVVLATVIAIPQFVSFLCTSSVGMITNVLIYLCCASMILEIVYQILKAKNIGSITARDKKGEEIEQNNEIHL
jgi:hypothetical protein